MTPENDIAGSTALYSIERCQFSFIVNLVLCNKGKYRVCILGVENQTQLQTLASATRI